MSGLVLRMVPPVREDERKTWQSKRPIYFS